MSIHYRSTSDLETNIFYSKDFRGKPCLPAEKPGFSTTDQFFLMLTGVWTLLFGSARSPDSKYVFGSHIAPTSDKLAWFGNNSCATVKLTLPYYENTHRSLRRSVFLEYLPQTVTSSFPFTANRLATLRRTFSAANIFVGNLVFMLKNPGFLRRTNFFSCWRGFGHCVSVLLVVLIPNMYSDAAYHLPVIS